MRIPDEQISNEAAYWGRMEEWTENIPEIPLWVDMRKAEYIPYPRKYLPAMASSFDPFTYWRLLGNAYIALFSFLGKVGTRIIEIGCGSGFMCLEMARMGKHVFAFDLSEQRIRFAKRYYESVVKKETVPGVVHYFVGNAENITFNRDYFDGVLCHASLHHLKRPEEVLDSIYRILKPGGLLIAFEHQGLDERIEDLFLKMDVYVGWFWSKKRVCYLLDYIFRRCKKIVDHPELEEGGSPMEGVSSQNMEQVLENSRIACIWKKQFSPFAFHFVERYATVYDWRPPFKIPAVMILKSIDLFLEKRGFIGELLFWVGEKKAVD